MNQRQSILAAFALSALLFGVVACDHRDIDPLASKHEPLAGDEVRIAYGPDRFGVVCYRNNSGAANPALSCVQVINRFSRGEVLK